MTNNESNLDDDILDDFYNLIDDNSLNLAALIELRDALNETIELMNKK